MYYIDDGDVGRNESESLKTCCSPNSVHTASQNAQWCEVPERFFRDLPDSGVNDAEASRWLQGNFTLCQTSKNWDHVSGANYCNLPKYNSNLSGAAVSSQGQKQLIAACLVVWVWFFFR
jgi:hypothetical protein